MALNDFVRNVLHQEFPESLYRTYLLRFILKNMQPYSSSMDYITSRWSLPRHPIRESLNLAGRVKVLSIWSVQLPLQELAPIWKTAVNISKESEKYFRI